MPARAYRIACALRSHATPGAPAVRPAQESPSHKAERRFLIEHLQLMARGKQVRPFGAFEGGCQGHAIARNEQRSDQHGLSRW
jgi:hypothetical protein